MCFFNLFFSISYSHYSAKKTLLLFFSSLPFVCTNVNNFIARKKNLFFAFFSFAATVFFFYFKLKERFSSKQFFSFDSAAASSVCFSHSMRCFCSKFTKGLRGGWRRWREKKKRWLRVSPFYFRSVRSLIWLDQFFIARRWICRN